MNENVDLFICTHTVPTVLPTNPTYKIISQKKVDIKTDLKVYYVEPEKIGMWGDMPRGLSELQEMYYARHCMEKKKFIGWCQYRSYPKFFNNVPDLEALMEDCDIITHRFWINNIDSVQKQYLDNEAYELYRKIFKEDYPEYGEVVDEYLNQTEFSQRNMFILRTEDFNKMIDFVFGVLENYLNRIGCHNDEELLARANDIIENKKYPENMRQYQLNPLTLSRFLAYFGEFVISFYVWKNFHKKRTMHIFLAGDRRLDGE